MRVSSKTATGPAFEVRDAEALREHYALTLRHWVRRLEARHDEAVVQVGERTYRIWRLYMAGSAGGLRLRAAQRGPNAARQTRPRWPTAIPLTRADVYA